MHTHSSTLADDATVAIHNPTALFFPILKRVTIRRDANASVATRADVQASLRFFDLSAEHSDVLDGPQWHKALRGSTQSEFEELMRVPVGDTTLTLHSCVKPIVARLLAIGTMRLRYPQVLARQQTQRLFSTIHQAVRSIPGQAGLADRIAADLSTQLSSVDRQQTSRLFVHGDAAWGCDDLLQAIALALAVHEGYKVLNIDCSAYRSEGEAASWDGAKAYWSGAAPGEVTAFIYKNPKAVILFHRLDETLPKVMAALRPALLNGEMLDHHGLEDHEKLSTDDPRAITHQHGRGRYRPTKVNCRQAVFLCGATHGTHWLTHRDAHVILGDTAAQQSANLLSELHNATRKHRGETTPLFDVTVLRQLADHHHVMAPLSWQVLNEQAQSSITAMLHRARAVMGVEVQYASISVANNLASLALCRHGAEMALAHAQPEALFRELIQPLQGTQLAAGQQTGKYRNVTMDFEVAALQDWDRIRAQLGTNPIDTLRHQNQFVDFSLGLGDFGSWQVTQVALKTVRRLSDYTGASGLVSHIPKETLINVAGQDNAKTFLYEIVGYLKSPKTLAKYGVHMPRGVVLHGPPGTGKTLLARALAGQAQLPFITVTGSELLNADLMAQVYTVAHRAEPCIVHIDEADVLGRRGRHSHAHDVAINLLLSRIDGFEQHSGIFHVLTTNRLDELDPALTRPGRIDRSFEIGALDVNGREACLARLWSFLDLTVAELGVAKERILKLTYGMTGAELALLHREVALRLARQAQSGQFGETTRAPLTWVIEEISRIQHGDAHERHACEAFRYRVAIHEAGHVLLHHLLMPGLRIVQVSITPRAGSAGFVALSSEGASKVNETPSAVRAYITVLLGGRAAEILVFGSDGPSSGASSDLARATEAAWKAVAFAGLDENFGSASLAGLMIDGKAPQIFHEAAARRTMQWVEKAGQDALLTLNSMRGCVDALASALLTRETLEGNEVADIVNSWCIENAHPKTVANDAGHALAPAPHHTN